MRSCEVLVNRIKAGILTEDDNGTFEFRYDKEYLKSENAKPVSLTIPLREEPYYSPYLFPAMINRSFLSDRLKQDYYNSYNYLRKMLTF